MNCIANQLTGFFMVGIFVLDKLTEQLFVKALNFRSFLVSLVSKLCREAIQNLVRSCNTHLYKITVVNKIWSSCSQVFFKKLLWKNVSKLAKFCNQLRRKPANVYLTFIWRRGYCFRKKLIWKTSRNLQ